MKIQYELSAIVSKLLLSLLLLTHVNGLPFLFGTSLRNRDHMIEYQTPDDSWNITSVPRSITPHLAVTKDQSHSIPPRKTDQQIEDELIKRLHDIKVRTSSIWPVQRSQPKLIFVSRVNCRLATARAECYGSIQQIWCTIHHSLTKHWNCSIWNKLHMNLKLVSCPKSRALHAKQVCYWNDSEQQMNWYWKID